MSVSNYLLEYMKIHLISIEQDQEGIAEEMEMLDENSKDYRDLEFEYNWLAGQIIATRHFIKIGEENAANNNGTN
jgi:hypothetical protein